MIDDARAQEAMDVGLQSSLPNRPIKTVGIITDGKTRFITPIEDMVAREAEHIAGQQFDIRFKRTDAFQANWDYEQARVALRAALNDPEVDLILASGALVTLAAARSEIPLPKPVISTFLAKSEAFGLSYTPTGKSEKPNFSFVVVPNAMATDLKSFQSMIPFQRLHVLVDEKILSSISQVEAERARLSSELGTPIHVISAPANLDGVLRSVKAQPDRVEALYVTPLVRLPDDDYQKLFPALASMKIPTYSLAGHEEVELGALAGQFPDVRQRVARRVALNIHQVLLGADPRDLLVYLPVEERLTINGRTAREVGYVPRLQTLIFADFLHREVILGGTDKSLSIEDAMRRAARDNVDIGIARAELESARQARNLARAPFLPQIGLEARHSRIDEDRAAFGFTPERRSVAGATVSQLLYNDEVLSRWRSSKRLFAGQQEETAARRLDAMAVAGTRFLDYWASRSLLRIDVKNLNLTRDNLNLARLRAQIGAGGPEEVLRWESSEARQSSTVLRRESAVRQALVALNQSLGLEDFETRWTPIEIAVDSDNSYFLGQEMNRMIRNVQDIEQLRRYSIQFALAQEPALHQLDFLIEAQRIAFARAKRQFVAPSVAAQFGYDRELDRGGANGRLPSALDRDEWTAALVVSIPLFEGGGRLAEVKQAEAELERLRQTRIQGRQLVEQRVQAAVFSIMGSYPSVELSRVSSERSADNLEIIREKYAQGTASITDLLEAQTQAFNEEQNATLAAITHLRDLIEYQRAIAWFEVDQSETEKRAWLDRLQQFLRLEPLP